MFLLTIDFESASEADLKEVGSWPYSQHPTTEILCLSWHLGDTFYEWIPRLHGKSATILQRAALDPEVMFEAHNAAFEQAMWANQMVPFFGMPPIPIQRWTCTMARSYYRGLPGALDMGAHVLGLGEEKDRDGRIITLGLSKPITQSWWMNQQPVSMSKGEWLKLYPKGAKDRTPATLQRVARYCTQDVRTEMALSSIIGPLSLYERSVWELDQVMNQRGLRIDMPYVNNAIKIVEAASAPLAKEFRKITGDLNPTQAIALRQWCNREGFMIPNLNKETLKAIGITGLAEDEEEIDDDVVPVVPDQPIPPHVRRVLEIRSVLGSASVKKLYRMRACVSNDGRVRYTMQYHGAHTGRWAGRLFQPQNFPRGKIGWEDGSAGHDPGQLITAIMSGDYQFVEACFGDPIAAVASGLRHSLVAADGCMFNVGDFAGIEARIVLALAGQYDKLDLMASGFDVYLDMAEDIYKKPKGTWAVTDKELLKQIKATQGPQRLIGKNTVLGCGFQMGWKTYKDRYCPTDTDQFAKDCIDAYRYSWAPNVPKLWEAFEEAALRAVWDKAAYSTHGVTYRHEGKWLAAYLPDGQIMYYYNPQPVRRAMRWNKDDIRDAWTYQVMQMGRWKTTDAYGGILTEQVVSKLARGLLCEAAFRLEANGLPLVLTVHDENASEVPEARSDYKLYEHIMAEPTALSRSIKLPISVEGWAEPFYKK